MRTLLLLFHLWYLDIVRNRRPLEPGFFEKFLVAFANEQVRGIGGVKVRAISLLCT